MDHPCHIFAPIALSAYRSRAMPSDSVYAGVQEEEEGGFGSKQRREKGQHAAVAFRLQKG
jgi:hypothetical protein